MAKLAWTLVLFASVYLCGVAIGMDIPGSNIPAWKVIEPIYKKGNR